jgi:hypothetical protein
MEKLETAMATIEDDKYCKKEYTGDIGVLATEMVGVAAANAELQEENAELKTLPIHVELGV